MPCICVRPCVRAPTQRSALLPHVHAFGVGTLPPSFPAASPAGLHAHVMRQPLDICLRPLQNLCFHRPHVPLRAPSMPPPLAQPNTTNTTHTHQPSLYVVLQSMSRGVASAYALQVVVQRAWQARGTQRGAIGHEEQREATTGVWQTSKLWKRCVGAMGARRCNGVARAGGRPW